MRNRVAVALSNRKVRAAIVLSAVVAAVTAPGIAGADVVSSAFGTETTSLTSYIGLGAVLVVTLMGIGLGIMLLVKWSRRAVHSA